MGKTLVIPTDAELYTAVMKAKKELKSTSTSECVRSLLRHVLMSGEIAQLRTKVTLAKYQEELEKAKSEVAKWQHREQQIQQQLEKVHA